MDVIRFRVHHTDGKFDEFFTEWPQVLVGSGAHCEIRLRDAGVRAEHVVFRETPAGWTATARCLDPPPTLDGVVFSQAAIVGACTLQVSRTRIEVAPASAPSDGSPRPRERGQSVRFAVYGAFAALGLGVMLAGHRHGSDLAAEPSIVPALWTPEVASCPQTTTEEARASGTARLGRAVAKQERSPFYPEDGVAAVPLYHTAAACFRTADMLDQAASADGDADRLQRRMTDEFRLHRTRLLRALADREWTSAIRESDTLLSFLSSRAAAADVRAVVDRQPGSAARRGEYVSWLSNLHRKLLLTYGSPKTP